MTNQEIKDAIALLITDPTNKQNTASKVREALDVIIDNLAPNGWAKVTLNLTQAQVRTLFSGNGGYGYKIYDAAGVNKIKQLANAILKFNHTGGTYPQNYFEIYSANNEGYAPIFNFDNSDQGAPTANEVYIFNTRKNPLFLGYSESSQLLNDDIWLYSNADFADYEGTATLIFDVRTIDFT